MDKDANGVFILHEDGTLDRSIFAEGRSSQEYMELGDMYVTDKLIYLFDNILMKILCFDLDGQYQKPSIFPHTGQIEFLCRTTTFI